MLTLEPSRTEGARPQGPQGRRLHGVMVWVSGTAFDVVAADDDSGGREGLSSH